jgi:hypothetical protein
MSKELIEKTLPVSPMSLSQDETLAITCGTKSMNQIVLQAFHDIGVPLDDIFKF